MLKFFKTYQVLSRVTFSGEFGGNMGLFLGCSILTLCEFIDFLWEVVMYRIRKHSVDITQKAGRNTEDYQS